MIGDEFVVSAFDVGTITVAELKTITSPFRCVISEDAELNALGGWCVLAAPWPMAMSTVHAHSPCIRVDGVQAHAH